MRGLLMYHMDVSSILSRFHLHLWVCLRLCSNNAVLLDVRLSSPVKYLSWLLPDQRFVEIDSIWSMYSEQVTNTGSLTRRKYQVSGEILPLSTQRKREQTQIQSPRRLIRLSPTSTTTGFLASRDAVHYPQEIEAQITSISFRVV